MLHACWGVVLLQYRMHTEQQIHRNIMCILECHHGVSSMLHVFWNSFVIFKILHEEICMLPHLPHAIVTAITKYVASACCLTLIGVLHQTRLTTLCADDHHS